jgi:hypothetical protein
MHSEEDIAPTLHVGGALGGDEVLDKKEAQGGKIRATGRSMIEGAMGRDEIHGMFSRLVTRLGLELNPTKATVKARAEGDVEQLQAVFEKAISGAPNVVDDDANI